MDKTMTKGVNKIDMVYSVFVAMIPFFAAYASLIPGLSLADLLLVFICGVCVIKKKRKQNVYCVNLSLLNIFWIFTCLISFVSIALFADGSVDNIIRLVRNVFYVFCVFYVSKRLLHPSLFKSAVTQISIISTIYIFVQTVVYRLFNIILLGFIPGLKLSFEDYEKNDYESAYAIMHRPTSFFLEPAHYARYVVFGIAIVLFKGKLSFKDLCLAVFLSLGVLISTSSQGYVLLALVWLYFLFTRLKYIKNRIIRAMAYTVIICMPAILYGLFQIPYVEQTLNRSLSGNIGNENTAIGARMGGYLLAFDQTPLRLLFGNGFGAVPEGGWFSGAAYWIYGCGVILFIVYLAFLIQTYIKVDSSKKCMVLLFILLFFTDDMIYTCVNVVFMSLIFLTERRDVSKIRKESV